MENLFNKKLQAWLNTPDEKKDWDEGALLLLQLTGNKIMYRNISFNPKGKAEFITGQLQKYLTFRLAKVTHDEVEKMQAEVDIIVKERVKPEQEFKDFKAGKRSDHDSLPEEIQALYAENLNIVHKMRELHMQLRNLSKSNLTCPDSDRYPFLKELISLDKQLHENWDTYDHCIVGQDAAQESASKQAKSPSQSKAKSGKKK